MISSRRASAPGRGALRRALLALGLAAAWGCSGTSRNPFAAPGTQDTQILVQAENRGFNDIRLYAVSSRGLESLGSLQGNTIRRLTLDWRQMEQLSFRMEVLAGRTYTTPAISVSPGDRVWLVIPSDPSQAYLQIR